MMKKFYYYLKRAILDRYYPVKAIYQKGAVDLRSIENRAKASLNRGEEQLTNAYYRVFYRISYWLDLIYTETWCVFQEETSRDRYFPLKVAGVIFYLGFLVGANFYARALGC